MSSVLKNGAELSAEEKRALLADLLREKAARAKVVPTSFAQQRLWFLNRLEPASPAYNIPRPLRIHGDLDAEVLRETFNRILARHEVLRGKFELAESQPVQVIASQLEIELPVVDLRHLSEAEREKEVSKLAVADAERPFDLSQAPLLRFKLLKLAPREHVLLLTMHHIISDGWSMGILVREMGAIYQALRSGQTIELAPLKIQYADFARWQRDWLKDEVLDEQLGYWRPHLAGAPAVLNLPIASSRPRIQTITGSHITKQLDSKLTNALRELSRREGATLFMTLLAAFKTLLYRYSGQDDLVVGSPIAGRNRQELEELIGFFVNSLPLRTSLAGNPTFRQLITRVRETALGAFAHQDLPFEKIVEATQPRRSLSYAPIFQVMFALQNQPSATFKLPGLEVAPLKREYDTSKFDLTLFMNEGAGGLECWLEYNTDIFASDSIERLLEHFETLLASVVSNPDRRIANLALLRDDEQQQLLVDWNDTAVDFPARNSVHEFFEAQAAKTPEAIALMCGQRQMNYAELNQRANQVARHLRTLGVGPESRVAICLPRSIEMVTAVLAVLKAGGAYVPLDPAYPTERLAFTLEDSNARVLLTNEDLNANPPDTGARRVFVESAWAEIGKNESTNLTPLTNPSNLAYVIYTSGSTGLPKGVAIEHRSTVAFLHWVLETFTTKQLRGVLLSTSLCFDLSVFELFAPLSCGGKAIIVENALELPELKSGDVTLVNTVPSAIAELVRIDGIPSSVETINLAGEPLVKSLVDRLYEHTQAQRVLNLYGPSEDTTYSTFVVAQESPHEPTIGKPIANTVAYVLDSHLQPVPAGIPGELHLSGAGLARGYLNRQDLTAEKFIPDPFSAHPGSRMYRTGDLARYQSDGEIQFLGRIDHQVKLRGYRIELGEIESVLRGHPAVQDTVVVMHEFHQGQKELVAHLAVEKPEDEETLLRELRKHLRAKLPEYMVPSYFHLLEKLPLTPNGKIDRRALPAPDRSRSSSTRTAPANRVEEQLVEIWKSVLAVDEVGVNDNFFEIGGHSLLAVRLVTEIEKVLGQKLPLVSLFHNTTIESLAEVLSHEVKDSSWPALIEIQSGKTTPLFCVSMPNVNALGYMTLARHLGAGQAVYGLQAQYPEDLQGEHSQLAVDQLATEYLDAIDHVQPHGPYQFVGMCRGAHIAFEMARRLIDRGEQVALVGILDTWVLENTYNKFLYVEYYAKRIRASLKLGLKDQLTLIKQTSTKPAQAAGEEGQSSNGSENLANPMRVYFPGPEFQPKTYPGKVSVFRAHSQPLNRIRDKGLGWGKLALGGVDLHYVPGQHGVSVLREPNVQILAAEIKKCLVD